jgi:hypothetical protein
MPDAKEVIANLPFPQEMQEVSDSVIDGGYPLKRTALNSLRHAFPEGHPGAAILSGVLDRFESNANMYLEGKTPNGSRKGGIAIPLDEAGTAYWVTGIHIDYSDGIPFNFGRDTHWLVDLNHPSIIVGIGLSDKSVHLTEYTKPEEGGQKHSELTVRLDSNGNHIIETISVSEVKLLDEKNHIQMRVERRRGEGGPGLVLVIKEDDYKGTTTTIHALAGKENTVSMAQHREGMTLDPVGVEISETYDGAYISYGNRDYNVKFFDGFHDGELNALASMPSTSEGASQFLLEAARLVWQSSEQAQFTIHRVIEYA